LLTAALLGVALLGVLPAAAHAQGDSATLCAADEHTLFACRSGRKTVSVCASADLSADAGRVQYRFGAPGAVELVYPAADADWRRLTSAGTLMYSGGGGAYLAFARPPYRYVVYTAVGRDWGSRAGVVVEKHGLRIASVACSHEPSSALGPDLFARGGFAWDTVGFVLP
jgi:hypothetical protein